MPHCSAKEILMDARKWKYGVCTTPGSDIEMVIGICRAAEDLGSPVILVFNEDVNPKIPMEYGIPMIVNAAQKCKAPVATLLDHGQSFEAVVKAIDLGLNSVMFDGSLLPYEENVAKTRQVVEYAHARGVSVEGELGRITGNAVEAAASSKYAESTDPDQAVDFIEKTGVDILAISFGNAHGLYAGVPQLDLDLVRTISDRVDIPLAMHGASGLDLDMYPKIIDAGISKLNYYSTLAHNVVDGINYCMRQGNKCAYHDLVDCTVDSFYDEMKKLIRVFRGVAATSKSVDEVVEIVTREVLELLAAP
jgi:fructose-bisphosphate aldolase, class II